MVPSVTIVASPSGTICSGTNVTFTATPVNGGTPSYQWFKDGNPVGSNSNTYADAGLLDGEVISVEMTSSLACVTTPTATSNAIVSDVTSPLVPSVSIVANPGTTICLGTNVTFTATPVNGGTPTYQWFKDGNPVGSNSDTYSDAGLLDGEVISVQMTSSLTCVTTTSAVSNNLTISISTGGTVTLGSDATICAGESVDLTFTLTGAAPWSLDFNDGVTTTTISGILTSPHVVSVNPVVSTTYTITSFSEACGVGTISSGTTTITVNPVNGDPSIAGVETWLGYVYNDAASPAPPVSNIDFALSKYKGFVEAADIDNASGISSYDVASDEFDLNLGNIAIQGPNVCGSYPNDFSIRFRMDKSFAAGLYTFTLGADDGVQLFIDGSPVALSPAGSFTEHSFATYTSNVIALTAGTHSLVVEYFERGGQARVSFSYDIAGGPTLVSSGDVCINTASPTLTASSTDPSVIGFNWYSDSGLTTLVASTAAYMPLSPGELDLTTPGATTFYATAVYAGGLETTASSITVNVLNAAVITPTDPTVCESSGIVDLTSFVSAVPAGGTFTFSGTGVTTSPNFDPTGLSGTTTSIAVSYTNGSCTSNTTMSVTVTNNAVISLPVTTPQVCENGGLVNLNAFVSALPAGGDFVFTGTQVNSVTDELDPLTLTGPQSITVDYVVGGCVATQVVLTLDVITTPSITLVDPLLTICENSGALDLTSNIQSLSPAGGTLAFSGAPNIFGNLFDPTGLPAGTYTVLVEYTVTGCALGSQTFDIEVLPAPVLVIDNSTQVCQNGSPIDLTTLVNATPSGGVFTFSGTGVSGTTFTPGILSGIQTIDVTYTEGGCQTISTISIDVTTGPDNTRAVTAFPSQVCAGASSAIVVTSQNNIVYQLRNDADDSPIGGQFLGNGFSINLPTNDLSATTTFNVLASNIDGSCATELLNTVTVTTRALNDPLCGSGGGGDPLENCTLFTTVVTEVKPTCLGEDDGQLTFEITGGNPLPNYTVILIDTVIVGGVKVANTTGKTGAPSTPIVFTGLKPAQYYYRVVDADANICTLPYKLDRQVNIVAEVVEVSVPICEGSPTGTARINIVSGGTSPYEYSIIGDFSDARPFISGELITDIPGNTAVILIRDDAADACPAEVTVNIQDGAIPPVILVTALKQDASCNGNDGSIQVNLSGGAGALTYKFGLEGNELDLTGLPTDNTFTGLASGDYRLIVSDASGCGPYIFDKSVNNGFSVGFPGIVEYSILDINEPTCLGGGSDGRLRLVIENNNSLGNYEFAILTSPTAIPADADYTPASLNPVTVSDALSANTYYIWLRSLNADCPTIATVDIGGAIPITYEATNINEQCFDDGGFIELSNIKGVPFNDFQYQLKLDGETIDPGAFTYTESLGTVRTRELEPGNYEITLLQSSPYGCVTAPQTVTIIGPSAELAIQDPIIPSPDQETSFVDDPSAVRIFTVTGGAPVYFMSLINSIDEVIRPATEVLLVNTSYSLQYAGLAPGTFTVQVTDEFGCVAEKEFVVGVKTEIFIPNVFTPNNDPDNRNEVFFIRNLAPSGAQLVISNRWGNEVYSTKNYQNDWNAEGVSDGIYFYNLRSNGQEFTGWVEIIRGEKP